MCGTSLSTRLYLTTSTAYAGPHRRLSTRRTWPRRSPIPSTWRFALACESSRYPQRSATPSWWKSTRSGTRWWPECIGMWSVKSHKSRWNPQCTARRLLARRRGEGSALMSWLWVKCEGMASVVTNVTWDARPVSKWKVKHWWNLGRQSWCYPRSKCYRS